METEGSGAVKPGVRYTIAERNAWETDEQWELINGIAWAMSPAPRVVHQRLLGRIYSQLAAQLEGSGCEAFIAPVDVYLFPDADDVRADTVVQPDLMVVGDPSICRDDGIYGAPDWVLEISSPTTAWKDQTTKRDLYQDCGVKEYWILNPDNLDLIIYRLDATGFAAPAGARLTAPTPIGVLPGVSLCVENRAP